MLLSIVKLILLWTCSHCGKSMAVFRNLNKELPYDPGIPLGLRTQRIEKAGSWRTPCSQKHHSQQWKGGDNPSVHWWMNRYSVCTHHGILYHLKKEGNFDTVSWMNFEDVRLTDVSGHKKANSVWFHSCEVPRGVSRVEKAEGWYPGSESRRERGVTV